MMYNYLPKQLTEKSLADRYLLKDLFTSNSNFPYIKGLTARYSAKGLTNEEMSKNPVWKDLTGNGYDLQMKNFAWSGMSGCNGYSESFSYAYHGSSDSYNTFKSDSEVLITGARTNIISLNYQKCFFDGYIRVSGLDKIANEITGLKIYLKSQNVGDAKYDIKEDGIYKIQIGDVNNSSEQVYFWIYPKKPGSFSSPVTIEILPHYPGFIIGDGVDDYAVTEKDLDFEDTYTVYTAFIPFQEDPTRNMLLCGKSYRRDFYVQYQNLNNLIYYSAGTRAIVEFSNGFNLIACKRTPTQMVAKNLLTGKTIVVDANSLVENPGLYYLWTTNSKMEYAKAAIAGQVICNGHFTSDEEDTKVLNWYKKDYPWLFFDQAWTVTGKTNEDTDRATIANITGNGNNLVLSNFGFVGNSGYGEYAYNWNTWKINKVDSTKSNVYHNRMEIILPAIGESLCTQCNFYSPLCEVGTIYDFTIKISGLTDNSVVFVKPGTNGGGAIIAQYNKDGVYHLNYTLTDEAIIGESTQNRIYFFVQNFSDEEMNLTVEQIPDHEGYLVTDGVDDYVRSSDNFTLSEKFTVVGEWELLDNTTVMSGLFKNADFFLYSNIKGLSFYCRQGNSATVFNDIKSLTAFDSEGLAYDHNWKEYVDDKNGNEALKTSALVMGTANNSFSKVAFKNIALYAEKVLSKEDMIKAYIYLQTLKAKY